MEGENDEIRVILRVLWKKRLSAAAAAREICEVEGDGVVSTRTAQNRYLLSLFGLYEKHYEIGDPSKNNEISH